MTLFGNFKVIIKQEEDGSYYAEVVNLPGCFSMGETLEELNQSLKEAIDSYLASIRLDLNNYKFNITSKDLVNA